MLLVIFPKIFPSPKMAAILNFRIFAKNGKTLICFYLLNRAEIERFRQNFRPTGYLRNAIFAIFQKIFPSPKMAAILNFRIFAKNGKTIISLTVRDRAISQNFRPTGHLSIVLLVIFTKFSPPQKWRPF